MSQLGECQSDTLPAKVIGLPVDIQALQVGAKIVADWMFCPQNGPLGRGVMPRPRRKLGRWGRLECNSCVEPIGRVA